MDDYNKVISLVIRVRNNAKDLQKCLGVIQQQVLQDGLNLEIIVVDNESTDSSSIIAKSYGAKVVSLPVKEFSWGRALNLGIEASSGEIVLLLSADAHPVRDNWISEMLKPFGDSRVAAVYGRQIPRFDAPIDEIIRLKNTFGSTSIVAKCLPEKFTPKRSGSFPVSNACAAILKEVWKTFPYDEDIEGGEDVHWSYSIFQRKYYLVYQASASVYHSHNDPVFRSAWRNLELMVKNVELTGGEVNFLMYIHLFLSKLNREYLIQGLGV